MKRYVFALSFAAVLTLACVDLSSPGQRLLVVAPVLDSVFVGDVLPARDVYLLDASGERSSPGRVQWLINPETVATVDPTTGVITGVSKGDALVAASVSGALSAAVVIVSRPLELTPLLDTIYLMPQDTMTVPLAKVQKTPGTTTIQFDPSPTPSVYTIDAAGRVTAQATGGPVVYRAHLSDGTNTVTDSGAIVVMTLTDTLGAGRFYMTAFGTGIRHQSGGALALNYERFNGNLAFQLVDTIPSDTLNERLLVTLPNAVLGSGQPLEIDSISPAEANAPLGSAQDPNCNPPRPWALWASIPTDPQRRPVVAYAHGTSTSAVAGEISITSYAPAFGGGAIIGGRYLFRAQRFDLYDDPLGVETIRGTFVAPLRERHTTCQG